MPLPYPVVFFDALSVEVGHIVPGPMRPGPATHPHLFRSARTGEVFAVSSAEILPLHMSPDLQGLWSEGPDGHRSVTE